MEKLKEYMKKEMRKIVSVVAHKNIANKKFFFCWGQARFDMLMDIDRELNLGVFFKKGGD